MKVTRFTIALALAGLVYTGASYGANPAQARKATVQKTTFEYGSYYQVEGEGGAAASPSDAAAQVAPAPVQSAPAQSAAPVARVATSSGSCSSCVAPATEPACCSTQIGCCDTECADPCGCGGGGKLFGGLLGFGLLEDDFTLKSAVFGADSPYDIGGWTQFGYHNRSNAIGNAGEFNVHPGNFNLHQQWMYLGKVADGSNGLDWGGRVDLVYGVDGADTQAFGNPPGSFDFQNGWDHGIYSWAMPQLYGELAMGKLSAKVGHFFTPLGYEVVPGPQNFFYSHAYTMYNTEPFTHTGVLTTYALGDNTTLFNGWTLGWNTGFDQNFGGNSYLGGVSQKMGILTLTYLMMAGNMGAVGGTASEGYNHSIVANFALTDKLSYIILSDMVELDQPAGEHRDAYSFVNYLLYTLTDNVKVGGRLEWWKNNGISHYDATLGFNLSGVGKVVFRPEIRHNWVPGLNQDETTVGMDAYVTY